MKTFVGMLIILIFLGWYSRWVNSPDSLGSVHHVYDHHYHLWQGDTKHWFKIV